LGIRLGERLACESLHTAAQGGSITAYDSIRRLVEHVLALSEEGLASLGIQDAALCQVWWANGGAGAEPPVGIETLQARIHRWLALSERPERKSEGRRSQTLLRELIDRLEADHVEQMHRDELDLLEAVYGLSQVAQNPETFERVRRAIAPRRARIAARRAGLKAVVGTPALTARFLVVRAEDILAAHPREVKVIAGVEMPSRGPVLVHCGHVRVLGDVPQNTTLVVEDGACVIDGYVLGRVAVSGNCEILENVSGVVISRNGDVRARNIVDGAFVVAKRGWVHFKRAAGAKMVFAGNAIHAADRCSRSRFFAPALKVNGVVEAGEVHVSRRVEAESFRSATDSSLSIVFRRSLSCKDYGENPGKAMDTDVARAYRCRAELQRVRQRLNLAVGEAENAAETALTYALAGDAAGQIAGEVLSAQRRLDVLNRVLIGLRTLYAEAETKVDTEEGEEIAAEDFSLDGGFLDQLDSEMGQIIAEDPADNTLKLSYDEVAQTRQRITKSAGKRKLMRAALTEISEKLARWRDDFTQLEKEVREGRERIRQSVPVVEALRDSGAARSRVLALQRLMQRAAEPGPNEGLRKRIEAPVTVLLLRTIEKRLALSRKFKEESLRLQKEFDALRDGVWNKFQVRVETADSSEQRIVIEGRFETSVRLLTDSAYLTLSPGEVPRGGERLATASKDEPMRYVCVGGRIDGESIEESAEAALATL